MDSIVAFLGDILLKCLAIFYSTLSGGCDNHRLSLSAKFLHYRCTEMLNDHLNTLCDIGFVQFYETSNLSFSRIRFATRVVFDFLVKLIKGRIFCVVLKNIKNESFFNSLLHRINMECFSLTMLVQTTKQLNGRWLWCGCKCKYRYIGLLTVSLDFTGNHIFNISFRLVTRAKRHCNCSHIFTSSGRMCLINDYRKTLIL